MESYVLCVVENGYLGVATFYPDAPRQIYTTNESFTGDQRENAEIRFGR